MLSYRNDAKAMSGKRSSIPVRWDAKGLQVSSFTELTTCCALEWREDRRPSS